MGNEKLLKVTAVSAITETAKLGQKFPMTGEAFDPFRGDSPGFELKSEKRPVPAAKPVPTGTYPRAAAEGVPSPEEGPKPEERLRVPQAAQTAKRSGKALLDAKSLRRAVILSEILAPPLSRRGRR